MVEHRIRNARVGGSSPFVGSICNLQIANRKNASVSEWLGRGLQIPARRFESVHLLKWKGPLKNG